MYYENSFLFLTGFYHTKNPNETNLVLRFALIKTVYYIFLYFMNTFLGI